MRQFYLAFLEGSALLEAAEVNGAAARHLLEHAEGIGSTVSSQSRPARKGSTVSSQLVDGPQPSPALFPAALSWSHYCVLMRVEQPTARGFYEIEANREGWSVRELERQIGSMLFERISASKNKDEVLALGKRGQDVSIPADVIKDPVVLEFLDLW